MRIFLPWDICPFFVERFFANTINFGGGPLSSGGGNDIFVAKFDASGNHLWSKRFGEANNQTGNAVAADASGNVVMTGQFTGGVDFGGGLLASAGSDDVFVAKLDAAGNHLWSKRAGDSYPQYGLDIATDSLGNSLVTGQFVMSMDFGGGTITSAGTFDIFVVKLGP